MLSGCVNRGLGQADRTAEMRYASKLSSENVKERTLWEIKVQTQCYY